MTSPRMQQIVHTRIIFYFSTVNASFDVGFRLWKRLPLLLFPCKSQETASRETSPNEKDKKRAVVIHHADSMHPT